MSQTIKLKRGTTTPTTSNIVSGEVAIDTSAKKLYINDAGTIKEIGGSPTVDLSNYVTLNTTQTSITGFKGFTGNIGISSQIQHLNDSNTYLQFDGDRIRLVAGGTTYFDTNGSVHTGKITNPAGAGWLDFNDDQDSVWPTGSTDNITVLGSVTHTVFAGDSNANGTGGRFYWGYGQNESGTGTFTTTMDLDRSGNLTTTGAIIANNNSTITGSGSTSNALNVYRGSDGASALRVLNTGEVLVASNYFYVNASQGAYFNGEVRVRGGISNDGSDFGGEVRIKETTDVVGDVKANTFYDRNNTAYYVDPASDSRVHAINFDNTAVTAPTTTNATAGARLNLYPAGSGRDYTIGIESSHMWFNTDGGFKWYEDGAIRMHMESGGHLNLSTGSLKVGGTTVIDSGAFRGRNYIRHKNSGNVVMTMNDDTYTMLRNPLGETRIWMGSSGYNGASSDTNNYYNGTTHYFRDTSSAQVLTVNSTATDVKANLRVNGTTVITSGRVLQAVTANANIITEGTLSADRIPNLSGDKITSVTNISDTTWHDVVVSTTSGLRKDTAVEIHGSGYLKAVYLNMTHGVGNRTSDTVFYSSNDTYIRKNDAAGFRTSLDVYSKSETTALIPSTSSFVNLTATQTNISGFKGFTQNIGVGSQIQHLDDSNTYLQFDADRIRLVAGGTTKFDSNNTYLTTASTIDADTVDGLDSTAFIRANANDNVTGHTEWQDGKQVRFGNGADFRIHHDGTNTFLRNYNHANGNIYFQGEDTEGTNHALLYMINATSEPYLRLFYNGAEKFKTQSYGGYATGYIQASASLRAPIFYDSDNTAYYTSPEGLSVFNDIHANNVPYGHADYSTRGTENTYQNVGSNNLTRSCFFRDNNDQFGALGIHIQHPTSVGYALQIASTSYSAGSNTFQIRGKSAGTWQTVLKIIDDGSAHQTKSGIFQSNASLRAPVFYDTDNTARYVDPTGTSSMLHINMNNGNLSNVNNISINDPGPTEGITWNGGNGWKIVESPDDLTTNSGGNFQFVQSTTRRMTLDTSGNMKVPSGSLHAKLFYDVDNTGYYVNPSETSTAVYVAGNMSIASGHGKGLKLWNNDNYKIYMSATSDSTWGGRVNNETTSDYNMYFRMSNGTNRGFVFRSGSNNVAGIDASGNFRAEGNVIAYASSDRKLKDNIKPIENALDKVCALNGYTFNWNDQQTIHEAGKADVGVIAQEVIEQFPEVCKEKTTAEGDTHLGVDYERLVPALIGAIRELKDEIESLKEKIK